MPQTTPKMRDAEKPSGRTPTVARRLGAAVLGTLMALAPAFWHPALAQATPETWSAGVETDGPPAAAPDAAPGNTTVVPRSGGEAEGGETKPEAPPVPVRLVALLTADGQRIDQGVTWRIFTDEPGSSRARLMMTARDAAPLVKLAPGTYTVNAAFGRAHLTRKITVKPGAAGASVEQFVLNAGGLRLDAKVGGQPVPAASISFSIYSDRDQQDNRKLVMQGVKPGLIIRLNAGIYHVVSTYGDANATVKSDVTVEAGKMTEATISHAAAKATFKLVTRQGGEAQPETQWTIQTLEGEVVKESAGALPTHILAPGAYSATARFQGNSFQKTFTLKDGDNTEVEVMMQ